MEDATKTIGETMREVEAEIDAEGNSQTSEENESTQAQATEGQQQKDEFEGDEEFKKEVDSLQKEMGRNLSFGQSKRFRELYRKMKDAERKATELEEASQTREQTQTEADFSEEQLLKLAEDKGYQLTKKQQEEFKDELESLFDKATPQEKEWWMKHDNALVKKIAEQLSPFVKDVSEMLIERKLDKSEKDAIAFVDKVNEKHGLKIDFRKDVEPELVKMVRANKNLNRENTNVLALTKEFFAERGIEFGKRLTEKETKELNEAKKKANAENSAGTSISAKDDSNKSFKEIMLEEAKAQGLSGFY